MILLGMGAALAAAYHYGFIKIQVNYEPVDGPAPFNFPESPAPASGGAGEVALRQELNRYLRQAMYYQDKDSLELQQALGNIVRFTEQNPNLLDPLSTMSLLLRENYFATLAKSRSIADLAREEETLINICKRRLEDYEQRGILNLPLRRDVLLSLKKRAEVGQMDLNNNEMSESEERKFVFQQMLRAYSRLIILYVADDSSVRNDDKANGTIESVLSALEAEFGQSFERAPIQGRLDSDEFDKSGIYNYIDSFRGRLQSNTSPTYSPELALKCLRPLVELLPSFESVHGTSPCSRIFHLQSISTLILDLACESAPEGVLIIDEDRQHLEEARRVQQRVLELAAAVDPSKKQRLCDFACIVGLLSAAKIAWRYGQETIGDQELEKASQLANSLNDPLLNEVVRRIDKDPRKTSMKHWEPVTEEECDRLRSMNADHDEKS